LCGSVHPLDVIFSVPLLTSGEQSAEEPMEFDCSHLRAIGIDIWPSPQCPRSDGRGTCPLPSTLNRASEPFGHLFSEGTFQQLQVLCRATFCVSVSRNDLQKVARALVKRLTDAVCYTAKWLKSSLVVVVEVRLVGSLGHDVRFEQQRFVDLLATLVRRHPALTEGGDSLHRNQEVLFA
jgi:hypothetical protein